MLVREHKSSTLTRWKILAACAKVGRLGAWKALCQELGECSHQVLWQPRTFFPHVVFLPKLVGILTLLGMWSSGWGEVGLPHLRPFMPESPKLPEPATRWNCMNLLVPADQQPAISWASSTCVCSIESFLWGYCLSLQTMEGNREPV